MPQKELPQMNERATHRGRPLLAAFLAAAVLVLVAPAGNAKQGAPHRQAAPSDSVATKGAAPVSPYVKANRARAQSAEPPHAAAALSPIARPAEKSPGRGHKK